MKLSGHCKEVRLGQIVRHPYAIMMKAISGITKIIEVATHQVEYASPRILPFVPIIALPNAARPLIKAISRAINPRVRHPNISTGVVAIIKKTTGTMAGNIT